MVFRAAGHVTEYSWVADWVRSDPILVGLVKAHRVVVGQWTAWSSGQLSMHQEQAGDWDWEERPNLDVSSTTAGEGKQSSGQRVQLMTSTDSLT